MSSNRSNFFYFSRNTPYEQLGVLARAARVIVLAVRQFVGGEYSRQATALTYYTLFAVVPLAALFFGISKGFALEAKLKHLLSARFSGHQETLSWIYKFADTTLREASGGWIAGIGVVFLFATVIMLASNIEDTFNMIWSLPKRRNIIHKVSNYLAILVVTPIMLIIAGGAPVIERTIRTALAEHSPKALDGLLPLLTAGTELIPFLVVWLIFSLIYCFVPNTRVRPVSAIIAALLAGALFYLLQNSLMLLQVMLAKYNTIYGSFSVVPLFLLWLQWSWLIILFGAEVAFVHQNAATGRFDKSGQNYSRRLRNAYLLAVTRLICRNYESGNGATGEEELIRNLQLTRYRAGTLLDELQAGNVIMQIDGADGEERRYVPAHPCAQLTPVKVFELLETQGETMPEPLTEPALANILDTCRKLEEAERNCSANRPLKDL